MFHLRKWYLDCTTSEGAAVIGYWARARWGALRVSYAGMLRLDPDDSSPVSRSTLRAGKEPASTDTGVSWKCPGLGVNGTWSGLCQGAERTLLESDSGAIRWSCRLPRAACEINLAGSAIRGLGYVEVLDMTIAPWRLPIRELRWGRWLADGASLVWIDWRGQHPLTIILEEGHVASGEVTDDGISLTDGRRLTLESGRTIRDGELGTTVLRSIPGVREALPPALLRAHEQKWLARGSMSPGGTAGWAIHERVIFGE